MIKLQDFARQQGVTDRAIQKHLKKHEAELSGHFFRNGPNGTWLDERAQDFIKALMIQKPVADVIDDKLLRKIKELEDALKEKENYIKVMEAGNISKQSQINKLEQETIPELKKTVKDMGDQLRLIEEKKQEQIDAAVKAAEDVLHQQLTAEHQKKIEDMMAAHEQALAVERSRKLKLADVGRFFKKGK